MGSLRNYPGRTKTDGDVTIKFDEFQDLALQKLFYEWQNAPTPHPCHSPTSFDYREIERQALPRFCTGAFGHCFYGKLCIHDFKGDIDKLGASLLAQLVKTLPAMQETPF